ILGGISCFRTASARACRWEQPVDSDREFEVSKSEARYLQRSQADRQSCKNHRSALLCPSARKLRLSGFQGSFVPPALPPDLRCRVQPEPCSRSAQVTKARRSPRL